MAKQQIIIPRDGIATGAQKVRAIYSPLTANLLGVLGETDMRRASHVEPGAELSDAAIAWLLQHEVGKEDVHHHASKQCWRVWVHNGTRRLVDTWWADLLPVDGPVLGPFDTNTEALAAEVVWLKEHNIPICGPCRDAAVAEIEGINEHNDTA